MIYLQPINRLLSQIDWKVGKCWSGSSSTQIDCYQIHSNGKTSSNVKFISSSKNWLGNCQNVQIIGTDLFAFFYWLCNYLCWNETWKHKASKIHWKSSQNNRNFTKVPLKYLNQLHQNDRHHRQSRLETKSRRILPLT